MKFSDLAKLTFDELRLNNILEIFIEDDDVPMCTVREEMRKINVLERNISDLTKKVLGEYNVTITFNDESDDYQQSSISFTSQQGSTLLILSVNEKGNWEVTIYPSEDVVDSSPFNIISAACKHISDRIEEMVLNTFWEKVEK